MDPDYALLPLITTLHHTRTGQTAYTYTPTSHVYYNHKLTPTTTDYLQLLANRRSNLRSYPFTELQLVLAALLVPPTPKKPNINLKVRGAMWVWYVSSACLSCAALLFLVRINAGVLRVALTAVTRELARYKLDLVGVQEVRWDKGAQ